MGNKLRNVMVGSGLTLLTNFALAQTPSADTRTTTLEEIIVTGSYLRSSTVAEEGAIPLDVITVDEIRLRGNTSVFEAVRSLPQLSGYADNDTRSGAADQKEVNLRGLGSEYTLLLLNGRRLASNDLNLIPFAAVERIEVLKDGASAVYGSDALAGVVNVILRDRYDGVEVSADYGESTHFGGAKTNVSALVGTSSERGSFMLTGQYEKWDGVLSTEHPLGRTDDLRRFGSVDTRFEYSNPGVISVGGADLMLDPSFAAGQTGNSPDDYVPAYSRLIEKQRINNLQNGKESGTFFASGSYDLLEDDRLELFAEFLHQSKSVGYTDHRGTVISGVVPAGNPHNPFGEEVFVNYQLDAGTMPGGRLERRLETLEGDFDTNMIVAGLRGTLGPVDYSLAYSNWEGSEIQTHDGLSQRGIDEQLARTDAGALNVFGNAAVTPDQLEPARGVFRRQQKDFVRSITGVASFEPFQLPAGGVGVAVGAETRNLGFESIYDEALSRFADSVSLPFFNDLGLSLERDVDAYFAEVNLPLAGASSNVPGVRALDLTLAARNERFSDFGNETMKRAALRWEPFDNDVLALRASYSESFYAPDLRNLLPSGDRIVFGYPDFQIPDTANGLPFTVYPVTFLGAGNPDLQPTTGETLNLGFILKPTFVPGLKLTVDAWKVDQEDAFVFPDAVAIILGIVPGGEFIRDPVALPGEPIGRLQQLTVRWTNAGTREVQGVDFNVAYNRETSWGAWSIESNSTYLQKFEFDQHQGDGPVRAVGQVANFYSPAAIPRFRSNLVLANQIGGWNFTLATNYLSGVTNPQDDFVKTDDYVKSDLTVGYDFGQSNGGQGILGNTSVWLSVQDVFDEGVPFVYRTANQAGVYSDFTFADYIGQFVTVGVRSKF